MARRRFSPLDRILGRIDDLDAQNLAILARRLERERDLMETVLDTLREGVIVLSHDGAIEYANASAVRLLGVNPDDVAGAELRRLSPDIAQALELPETVGALTRELEVRYPEPRLLTLHLARVGEQPQPFGKKLACGLAMLLLTQGAERLDDGIGKSGDGAAGHAVNPRRSRP